MSKWCIEFNPKAEKELSKLGATETKTILHYLRKKVLAAKNPRILGKALVADKAGLWHYRVGKYRIICKIEDNTLVVLVLRIAKRDKVYN